MNTYICGRDFVLFAKGDVIIELARNQVEDCANLIIIAGNRCENTLVVSATQTLKVETLK